MIRTFTLAAAALLACTSLAAAQTTPAPGAGDTTQQSESGAMAPADAGTMQQDPAINPNAAAPGTTPNPPMTTPNDPNATMTPGASDTTEGAPATPPPPNDMGASATNSDMGSASSSGGATASMTQYDQGGKGYLTPLEFAKMRETGGHTAMADRDRTSRKANNAAVSLLNRHSAEFARMDMNRDGRLTQDEVAMPGTTASM